MPACLAAQGRLAELAAAVATGDPTWLQLGRHAKQVHVGSATLALQVRKAEDAPNKAMREAERERKAAVITAALRSLSASRSAFSALQTCRVRVALQTRARWATLGRAGSSNSRGPSMVTAWQTCKACGHSTVSA